MGPDAFFTLVSVVLGFVSFLLFIGIFVRLGRAVELLSVSNLHCERHSELLIRLQEEVAHSNRLHSASMVAQRDGR